MATPPSTSSSPPPARAHGGSGGSSTGSSTPVPSELSAVLSEPGVLDSSAASSPSPGAVLSGHTVEALQQQRHHHHHHSQPSSHSPLSPEPSVAPPTITQDASGLKVNERGEWHCPACGNWNYPIRKVCNLRKCRRPKYGYHRHRQQEQQLQHHHLLPYPQQQQQQQQHRLYLPPTYSSSNSRGGKGQHQASRDGKIAPEHKEWTCRACGNLNYPHRTRCNMRKCGVPRPEWTCPACGNFNYAYRTHCNLRKCRAPRPGLVATTGHYSTALAPVQWNPVGHAGAGVAAYGPSAAPVSYSVTYYPGDRGSRAAAAAYGVPAGHVLPQAPASYPHHHYAAAHHIAAIPHHVYSQPRHHQQQQQQKRRRHHFPQQPQAGDLQLSAESQLHLVEQQQQQASSGLESPNQPGLAQLMGEMSLTDGAGRPQAGNGSSSSNGSGSGGGYVITRSASEEKYQ